MEGPAGHLAVPEEVDDRVDILRGREKAGLDRKPRRAFFEFQAASFWGEKEEKYSVGVKLTLLKFRLECVLTGTSRRIVKYKLYYSACLRWYAVLRPEQGLHRALSLLARHCGSS